MSMPSFHSYLSSVITSVVLGNEGSGIWVIILTDYVIKYAILKKYTCHLCVKKHIAVAYGEDLLIVGLKVFNSLILYLNVFNSLTIGDEKIAIDNFYNLLATAKLEITQEESCAFG